MTSDVSTNKKQLLKAGRHAVALLALIPTTLAHAQEAPAKVHGHVQNAAGIALASGQVKFTKDLTVPFKDEKFTNTVEIDKEGNYTATGVAPGEYFIYVQQGANAVDRMQVKLAAGEEKTVDFDMTRAEYIDKMSPEEKKTLAEYKAKNTAAVNANKQIAGLNATLQSVRADMKSPSPNFEKDLTDIKQATDARPEEPLLWATQGEVQLAQADHAAAEDRKNKVAPSTDDKVKMGYTDAITSYKKAEDLMASGKTPNVAQQASIYNQLGTIYGKAGQPTDASAAFDKAVSLQPASAGLYYENAAATLYNSKQDQAALDAANKAITADPNRPKAYYIKGQELLQKATVDAKGAIVPPPGCVDAFQKYLELAPDGPEASAVKETLTAMGQKVTTKYRAPGAKR